MRIYFSRKPMIMTGMSLNICRVSVGEKLTNTLQEIISKHRNHCDDEPVCGADIEIELRTAHKVLSAIWEHMSGPKLKFQYIQISWVKI